MLNSPNAPKVLVIESSIQLNHFLQQFLVLTKRVVIPTYTVDDALNIIRKECITLIVVDLELPDGNGWETMGLLEAALPPQTHPRMIVIHPYDAADSKISQGKSDYWFLRKPVNTNDLMRLALQIRYERKI